MMRVLMYRKKGKAVCRHQKRKKATQAFSERNNNSNVAPHGRSEKRKS